MYRIYDNIKKKFFYDGFYLSPNNDLSVVDKTILGYNKVSLVPDGRYTYQMSIGLADVNKKEIFEGDICQANDGMIGLIAYVQDKASYLFLDFKNDKYYPLDKNICNNYLEVIGNTFDTPELIEEGGYIGE